MPYMFMKLLNYYYLMADSDFDNAVFHGPFLREDIHSLNGLDPSREEETPFSSGPEPVIVETSAVQEPKPAAKKPAKPKWLKL